LSKAQFRRVRERAGILGVYRAIRVDRHAARRRELSRPRAVRPHREELFAVRVATNRIAARQEHHGPGDFVRGLEGDVDCALKTRVGRYAAVRWPVSRQMREGSKTEVGGTTAAARPPHLGMAKTSSRNSQAPETWKRGTTARPARRYTDTGAQLKFGGYAYGPMTSACTVPSGS